MPNYSKTLIYQIRCKDETIKEKYIGHTTNFTARIKDHLERCNSNKRKKNYKVYEFIRNNGGWDNWICEIILEYPCENKKEAELKEREYIEALGDLQLNKQLPLRSGNEWYYDNKDTVLSNQRNHYQNNIERIRKRHREYAQNNPLTDEQRDIKNRQARERYAKKKALKNETTESLGTL